MICKNEFDKLISVRIDLNSKLASLETKLAGMKEKYTTFIEHNTKRIYILCLDSFYFQYKILHVELEHYKRVLALINNRMYGDYYKLFVIICAQCKEVNLNITISENDIIVYKDLDPLFDYKINDITYLFNSIVTVLEGLYAMYNKNNATIHSLNLNNSVGFSIVGFLSTLKYENKILNEQISLYLNYMDFYQSSQKGYLNKTLADVVQFSDEIDSKILVNYRIEHDACKDTNQLNSEPIGEPELELVLEPEPIKEPLLEPVLEPLLEPVLEPIKEPELEPEPIKEPVLEPIKEPELEPVLEPIKDVEPILEPNHEPIKENIMNTKSKKNRR